MTVQDFIRNLSLSQDATLFWDYRYMVDSDIKRGDAHLVYMDTVATVREAKRLAKRWGFEL